MTLSLSDLACFPVLRVRGEGGKIAVRRADETLSGIAFQLKRFAIRSCRGLPEAMSEAIRNTVTRLVEAAAPDDTAIDVYMITRQVVQEHLGLSFEQIGELVTSIAAERSLPIIMWDRRAP